MKSSTNRLLEEIPSVLGPGTDWIKVEAWIKAGRPHRRFHLVVWLSRVWRWTHN